jgi:tetratricopeptide (TPR) repeat protein
MTELSASPAVREAAPLSRQRSPLPERRLVAYIVCGLVAAVVCAYALIVRADFIHFDDNNHVFENPLILDGLSWRAIGEAFTKAHASLWIPLTWISFMTDVSIFGLNPGAMHAVNLAWHTASTVLLFFTLRRMTASLWASAFVAALFGLHPLNVESVAWIAERKDVLNTFFWFAAIAAYARYAEKARAGWYLAALVATLCALLAKPMAVTLPCTLLLLDFWPLNRLRTHSWVRLFAEKLPFFLLSAGTCWMTLLMRNERAIVTAETLPIVARLSNALVSYASYLGTLFFPVRLGVFYPHPIDPQPLLAGGAALMLVALTAIAWSQRKTRPYLLVGWLWFLGVLVPVIGLMQIGSQARADRFTYVPQIGIFLAVTWLVKERWRDFPIRLGVAGGAVLAACVLLTMRQVAFWMNGATLFERTIAVTENNACAYANAGLHRAWAGEFTRAIPHFQASLRIQPSQGMIWRELGRALLQTGRAEEAVAAFRSGLQYGPDDFRARYLLAVALQTSGAAKESVALLEPILRDAPDSAGAHHHLALALEKLGRVQEAHAHLREAARLAPGNSGIGAALSRARVRPDVSANNAARDSR